MREHGNGGQWGGQYPPRALLLEDIKKARMHLIKDGDELLGAFVFFVGEEPAYRAIDGKWLTDSAQYGVIHRVASAGKGGFMRLVVEFCTARADDLRIDTHRDNAPMRGALEKPHARGARKTWLCAVRHRHRRRRHGTRGIRKKFTHFFCSAKQMP